jgi:hypothetical protein
MLTTFGFVLSAYVGVFVVSHLLGRILKAS